MSVDIGLAIGLFPGVVGLHRLVLYGRFFLSHFDNLSLISARPRVGGDGDGDCDHRPTTSRRNR